MGNFWNLQATSRKLLTNQNIYPWRLGPLIRVLDDGEGPVVIT